ncbi:MAG: hypothetical protein SFW35_01750 [Chitinophagales bacterium]|nr:hypothetical protein [Chitinophagales bacterium]
MDFKGACLWVVLFMLSPYSLLAQTEEIECLKSFNSTVHQTLRDLTNNKVDVSSNSIRLIFEFFVSENGKIDSAVIKKSNLGTFGISETAVTAAIIGKPFPCLRDVYYKGELIPDKIVVPYNTNIIEDSCKVKGRSLKKQNRKR